MLFHVRKILASCLCLLALSSVVQALETEEWGTAVTEPWSVGEAAVVRPVKTPTTRYSLSRTQTWANGLASSTLLTVLVIPAIYVVLRDDAEELPPVEGGEAAA